MGHVGILDCGAGNVFSIIKALDAAELAHKVVSCPADIDNAAFLLLPGVGSFDQVMDKVRAYQFFKHFMHAVQVDGKPLVGICIGMHILCEGSEEGKSAGLSLINDSKVVYFSNPPFRTNLGPADVSVNIFINPDYNRFYFLHSLHVEVPAEYEIAFSKFGNSFPCMVMKDNIVGIQFHPEKSHQNGVRLLRNLYEYFTA